MKKTAFTEIHRSLGAKLVDFAGFEMPVQYSGIIDEHLAVRNNVGVFDVTHMGEFIVRGKDAAAFIQRMTINDVSKLFDGRVQYSAMCYDDGGIVDDLLVYHCGDHYMLVVNASNTQKDFDWLKSHLSGDVDLQDKSASYSLLAVQGPHSLKTLQKISSVDLAPVEYYHFVRGKIAGEEMIISRTGYTGELGFELYFDSNDALGKKIWDAVFDAGKEFGIKPIGLGARDTLRLEMGFCLYGNDIDQTTNPLEAGLGWITKLNKGDFVGKPAVAKVKQEGLKRRLVGFNLAEKAVARHGYPLASKGAEIGHVTSGTFSPSLERAVGLGYVAAGSDVVGNSIQVLIRGKEVGATIVDLPFVKK
ncbi:MAG TPA: glycine cleavage system aminomethyltransferase GcvT [Bacteroidota bacterium]|nr:glycine cleavage system aminomethyltransferase GcvT [Bacteroidota bacterium]